MTLRRRQIIVANNLIKRKRVILHAYCGFGKTITSIYGAKMLGLKPSIICPANVVLKFKETARLLNVDAQVISWNKITSEYKNLSKDLIILDECHKLKNCSKTRSACFVIAARKCKYLWMMSATPSKYRPSDLYMQIKLCGGHRLSLNDYRYKFCGGYRIPNKLAVIEGTPTNIKEFKKMLDSVRIFIEDDRPKPEIIYKILGQYHEELPKDISKIAEYRHNLGLFKVNKFLKITHTLDKGVIFAHHLDCIYKLKENLGCNCIVGGMKAHIKSLVINEFLNNKDRKFLIVGITAGGEGIDIGGVNNAYFVEFTYSGLEDKQAYMRLVRSEKGHKIKVYYFLSNMTEHNYIVQLKRENYLDNVK